MTRRDIRGIETVVAIGAESGGRPSAEDVRLHLPPIDPGHVRRLVELAGTAPGPYRLTVLDIEGPFDFGWNFRS